MKKLLPFTFIAILLFGCGANEDYAYGSYSDGTYCAEVDYYNPNTGNSSTYTLEVEIEDDDLTTIHWPNGGWLDDSHFSSTDISGGSASFTSDRGYEYTVTITGEGGNCYTSSYIDDEEEEEDDYLYDETEDVLAEEEY
ncbi:hypothetical protein [Pontibacter ramchanderi]|uniref:Uncharacterized protein n=1 Tax=Pontibacter ramchanderi TaxID=1179743 RepID=A0A2N3V0Y5_9BACT|nr:hypothetical protein [Pontibacter ramchanderi]PKV75290.1 hypothetical protein BD749_0228 [Pontibacter ramchanderi]